MTSCAVIIGIDNYYLTQKLNACVNDALLFRDWIITKEKVEAEDIHMLLDPLENTSIDINYKHATKQNLVEVLIEVKKFSGDRLYFYFAGHGLSSPSASFGSEGEPVLVPADFNQLDKNVIGFSEVIRLLSSSGPKKQFFFIDACRDLKIPIEKIGVRTNQDYLNQTEERSRDLPERRDQYVIYATSLGKTAKEMEVGKGIFTPALIDGLNGKGTAKIFSKTEGVYEVRFSTLSDYVRFSIQRLIAKGNEEYLNLQVPDARILSGSDDSVIARVDNVDDIEILLHIPPDEARKDFQFQAWKYIDGKNREMVSVDGPPEHDPYRLQLPPGDYVLVGSAPEYEEKRQVYSINEFMEIGWHLIPGRANADISKEVLGNREISYTKIPNIPEYYELMGMLSRGRLIIKNEDSATIIRIKNENGNIMPLDYNRTIDTQEINPGLYHLQILRPEGASEDMPLEIRPGKVAELVIEAPLSRSGKKRKLPKTTAKGLRLDSILNLSSMVQNLPKGFGDDYRGEGFQIYRSIKSFNLKEISGSSGLLVLLGLAQNESNPENGEIIVRDYNKNEEFAGYFAPLDENRYCGQVWINLKAGCKILDLYFPEYEIPINFAISCISNGVTVLVAAKDKNETIIKQHIFNLELANYWSLFLPNLLGFDLLDDDFINREYTARIEDLRGRIHAKLELADPLLGCLAGYYLLKFGQKPYYSDYALQNLVSLSGFREVPDCHVLAGLYDEKHQDEHFIEAMNLGLPVFLDGFHILYSWLQGKDYDIPDEFKEPEKGLLPDSIWTSWRSSK